MGNPATPALANLVMNDLVITVLEWVPFQLALNKICVDDTFFMIRKGQGNIVLEHFNNYHNKLQFTVEGENNIRIYFLDVEGTRIDRDILRTNWYTIHSSSGRILNFIRIIRCPTNSVQSRVSFIVNLP